MLVQALFDLNGGLSGGALTLTLVVLAAAAIGIVAHRATTGRLEIGAPQVEASVGFALLVVFTLAAAIGVGLLFDVAYANRYISIVLIPFVIAVGLGINRLNSKAARWLVAAAVIVGLLTAVSGVDAQRSEAPRFAAALADAPAGDVVVYCPDQLGPATSRLLASDLTQLGYPRGTPPERVNWIDYADAWQAASPSLFAARADALAADHDLWVVINTNYYGTEADCRALLEALQKQRPNGRVVVGANGRYFENGTLWELPPG